MIKLKDFIAELLKIEHKHGGDLDIYVGMEDYDLQKRLVEHLPIVGWTDISNPDIRVYPIKKDFLYDATDEFTDKNNVKKVVSIVDFDVWREANYAKNINK